MGQRGGLQVQHDGALLDAHLQLHQAVQGQRGHVRLAPALAALLHLLLKLDPPGKRGQKTVCVRVIRCNSSRLLRMPTNLTRGPEAAAAEASPQNLRTNAGRPEPVDGSQEDTRGAGAAGAGGEAVRWGLVTLQGPRRWRPKHEERDETSLPQPRREDKDSLQ